MAVTEAFASSRQPGNRLVGWVVDPQGRLPADARTKLVTSLYSSLPMFVLGIMNALFVSSLVAVRMMEPAYLLWPLLEISVALLRIWDQRVGRRAIASRKLDPTFYILLALGRSMSIGYGMFISMTSGDLVVVSLACLSGAAMVGGMCVRNFAAPRLVGMMAVLSMGPCVAGAIASHEPMLLAVAFQVPLYVGAMTFAAFELNRMMVRTLLAEHENERRTLHDPLTGLLNRTGLASEVARRIDEGSRFTVFYLDLDGFKGINESFDHEIGDALLKAVAQRFAETCHQGDSLARIGGDEFVVVTPATEIAAVAEFGRILVDAIAGECFVIGDEAACVSVSAGAAIYPDHGLDLGLLLGEADSALYQAKYWGRSRCAIARVMSGPVVPQRHSSLPSGPDLLRVRGAV